MSLAPPLLLTFDEAGDQLGMSGRTVRRMVEAGELPYVPIRGVMRVPFDALREWIAAQQRRKESPAPCLTDAPIPRSGGSPSRTRAASELESLLAHRTGKKPRHLRVVSAPKSTA